MRFFSKLQQASLQNDSLLCVGLDPDPQRYPSALEGDKDYIFSFCKAIVDASTDLVCAFKPQIAYFAAQRAEPVLERLIAYMHEVAPNVPVILDAKRGDIGSTAKQYAFEAFERYRADAVTLSPYMGFDTIEPYLEYPDKGVFLLCRTSNPGGSDLQALPVGRAHSEAEPLYEYLARKTQTDWNRSGQIGLVVGATYPQELARIRDIAPDVPLLIPGVGAQGADAAQVVQAAWSPQRPIVVNSSRAILYASTGPDFAQAARLAAQKTREALRPSQANKHNV